MSDCAKPGIRALILAWGGSVKLLGALAEILEEVSASWFQQVKQGSYTRSEPELEVRATNNANAYALAASLVRDAVAVLQKGAS